MNTDKTQSRRRTVLVLLQGIATLLTLCVVTAAQSIQHPPQRPRVLNNFVTQLVRAEGLDRDGSHLFEVENPRTGWIFFRTTATTGRSGSVTVSIESQGAKHRTILDQGPHALKTLESMQRLKKGAIKVRVELRDAELKSLDVRTIPATLYDHWPTSNKLEAYGEYSWEFLERQKLLANLNTVSSWAHWTDKGFDFDGENSDIPLPWLATGRYRIGICSGLQTGETAYRFWSTALSPESGLEGIIIDEFYPKLSKHFADWVATLKRVMAEHPEKLVYLYLAGAAKDLRPFVEPLKETHAQFVLEVYTDEARTEKEMNAKSFGVQWTKDFEAYFPGFTQRCIHAIGFMSGAAPGKDSGDIYPSVSYKVLKDVQFHRIATDPALQGLGGVGNYNSIYIDEEYMRWYGRLLRHYCIEGGTERLTADPYELPHIRNPDFEQGLEGWTLEPAVPGSMEVRKAKDYGMHVQGRHMRGVGDDYLWIKRHADKPNVLSQEIRNLEPGRYYSVRLYTTDLQNMHRWQVHPVSIHVLGKVREVPSETIHDAWQHAAVKAFGNRKTYPNYHRIVFKALGTTATLKIADWKWISLPTAPVGQELMLNFIQVEPYLMRE